MNRYEIALGKKPPPPAPRQAPPPAPRQAIQYHNYPDEGEIVTWEEPAEIIAMQLPFPHDDQNYAIDHRQRIIEEITYNLEREQRRRGWPEGLRIEWSFEDNIYERNQIVRGTVRKPARRETLEQARRQFEDYWRGTHTTNEQMARVVGADGSVGYYRTR